MLRLNENHLQFIQQYSAKKELIAMIDGTAKYSNEKDLKNHIEILKASNIDDDDQDGNTLLHYAVIKGNIKVIKKLIESKADVNSVNQHNKSILDDAKKNLEIVNLLIDAKADINRKDSEGHSLLYYYAAIDPNVEVVRKLIESNADVNTVNNKNVSLLNIVKDDLAMVKMLIDAKADINKQYYDGSTILRYYAVIKRDPEIVQMLIKAKADVKSIERQNKSILIEARKDFEITELLINAKAELNVQDDEGNTLLHHYIQYPKDKGRFIDRYVIGKLIENKADSTISNKLGLTPLTLALKNENHEAAKYLVQNNVDVNQTDKNGLQPFMYLFKKKVITTNWSVQYYVPSCDPMVEFLLQAKANPNCKDEDQMSPLQYAVMHHKNSSLALLIKAGVDVNTRDDVGNTVLHLAFMDIDGDRKQNDETVKILLESKANPQLKNIYNETPVYVAATRGWHGKYMSYFVEHGVDINLPNSEGDTPLHIASSSNWAAESFYSLLEAKANPNIKNSAGKTPLSLIASYPRNVNFHYNLDRMKRLLEIKAELTQECQELLPCLIADGRYDHLKLLLERKADPNMIIEGKNIFEWLCTIRHDKAEYLQLLLKAKANLSKEQGNALYGKLFLTRDRASVSHLLDAKVAIDDVQTGKVMGDFIYFANCHVMDDDNHSYLKPFVHLKDQDGKNVLYYAVKEVYTNCNLIKLLLKAKANPCMKDNKNHNVLEQVKHSKLNISPKVFEILRQAIRDATPPTWYEQFFAVKAQPSEQKDHTHMPSLKK